MCKYCQHPRFKTTKKEAHKDVPLKRMFYLPITPRLQRLYYSDVTVNHMRWHAEHSQEDGKINHPSDAEAWKVFSSCHSDFAAEPRNVRLGLCTDGFSSFGMSQK